MRRIAGVDINGWRDAASRDWDPDEPGEKLTAPLLIDGGSGSVAVRQQSGEWIGGPQAVLAPHGRGQGWGILGSPERRVPLSEVCEDLMAEKARHPREVYAASVNALTRGADTIVATVPDLPEFNEAAQGRVATLLRDRRRNHRLLWRSIAVFLYALQSTAIPRHETGARIRVLVHTGSGFEMQILRLRADSDHLDHVAPERDGYGTCILQEWGLAEMRRRIHDDVLQYNPAIDGGKREESRLALRLMTGEVEPGEIEILRRDNGNWIEAVAPEVTVEDLLTALVSDQKHTAKFPVAMSFLVTPLAERFAAPLAERLGHWFPGIRLLPWSSVAQGALHAGLLIERGLPHYFDRLTPIGLAVQQGREPLFADLIGTNATLPANREYVSPVYRGLSWGRGKGEIDFFVLKGDSEVRHWQITQDKPPERDVAVELRLQQTPGQSWAKLSLSSPDWEQLQRSPILLDWGMLSPIDDSPEAVLSRLRTPPPTIPERIVEEPDLAFWLESLAQPMQTAFVKALRQGDRFSPLKAANFLQRSLKDPETQERRRPVGTDGILPNGLKAADQAAFFESLRSFGDEIVASAERRRPPPTDNEFVRAVTWAFTLCPERAQSVIVDALEADAEGRGHPLLMAPHARRVLTQGAGRAVTSVKRLRRVIDVLVRRPPNTDTLSALASILSRRAEAPHALTTRNVELIVRLLARELDNLQAKASFKIRFANALSTAAGLFRYREVEPFALLAGRDPNAEGLRQTLAGVDELLDKHARQVSQFAEKKATIRTLNDYLSGHGDPNILRRIDKFSDDDL